MYKAGDLEKHYTDDFLIEELFKILDSNYKEEIIEYLENSAGSGNILNYINKNRECKNYIAYDISNETNREDIKECNYLKEKIEYKKGRVAVINPPFKKGLMFVYKALEECDYVCSILAATSLLSIDYEKYEADELIVYKNYNFGTCKNNILLVGIRKKII